jgi:hypothetical protein
MNEALAALDTIKEADITYIKKLGNPPAAIKLVLEAVCVILEAKPAKIKDDSGKMVNDYWKPSVALLNEKVRFCTPSIIHKPVSPAYLPCNYAPMISPRASS